MMCLHSVHSEARLGYGEPFVLPRLEMSLKLSPSFPRRTKGSDYKARLHRKMMMMTVIMMMIIMMVVVLLLPP